MMRDYKVANGVIIIELESDKIVKVSEKYIKKSMDALNISELDAVQIYLEDEGYDVNEEQEELTAKAKENKSLSVHKARSTKVGKKREATRKANPDKEAVIADLAVFLKEKGATEVVVENVGKIVTFTYNEKNFKLDLIETRVKKDA